MGCILTIRQVIWALWCCAFSAGLLAKSPKMQSNCLQPLTLQAVLESVDACYPQIEVARLEVMKSRGNYLSAKGAFDPKLNIYTNSTPVGGYVNNYGDTELIVPTLLNGLTLFGGYRNGNGNWPVYYENYLTNSYGEYRTGLNFPLMRDRAIDEQRTALMTRKERIAYNKQAFAETKIRIYHEAIEAYWQWVQTGLQMKIINKLLRLAQVRQTAMEQQANAGDLARLVISENLQQIMQRQQLLNQGRMMALQAATHLSLYYRDQDGNPQLPEPTQLPKLRKNYEHLSLDAINCLYDQLYEHPGLQKLERQARIMYLEKNQAKNAMLPYLNASAYTTKQYGTGGYPLLIPQAIMAGVTFKFPVYQRVAKGQLIRMSSELRQVEREKKFLFDQLNNRLAKLLIMNEAYERQIKLLSKELGFAKKVQFGEVTRFHEGDSSLFLVNQREQATAQVELSLIRSQAILAQNADVIKFFVSSSLTELAH